MIQAGKHQLKVHGAKATVADLAVQNRMALKGVHGVQSCQHMAMGFQVLLTGQPISMQQIICRAPGLQLCVGCHQLCAIVISG